MFRKTLIASAVIIALVVAGLATAMPSGQLPVTAGKPQTFIQNASGGIAPQTAKSRCDTVTLTKGAMKSYSTAGYVRIDYKVHDSALAPVVVKRSTGTNTAYMPESGGTLINSEGTAFSKIAFTAASTASRALTTCVERQ